MQSRNRDAGVVNRLVHTKEEGEGGDIEGVGRMIPQRFGNGNNNNKVMKKKRNKSKI